MALATGTGTSFWPDNLLAPDNTRKGKIKEMLASPIKEMQALGKTLKAEEDRKDNLHLELAMKIQKKFPEVILGGSASLYIHGIRLSRYKNTPSQDLDLVIPYYINFQSFSYGDLRFEEGTAKSTDFDLTMKCNGVNLDVRIDNKQKWEMVELDDYMYKVGLIENTIEAKVRYALNGNLKHKNDLYEMLGKIKESPIKEEEHSVWSGS